MNSISATTDATTQARPLVRKIEDCPHETLENIEIVRVLAGTDFDQVGCEYVVLKKGQTLEAHVHKKASSFILILDGKGAVELDGVEHHIGQGHTIYVPAGVLHGFSAPDEDLILYGFQSPPIIASEDDVDIFFVADGHQGKLVAAGERR